LCPLLRRHIPQRSVGGDDAPTADHSRHRYAPMPCRLRYALPAVDGTHGRTVHPSAVARGEAIPIENIVRERLYGYQLWGGLASAAVFLGALVFLVITGPLRPTPAWRSAALLGAGAAGLGIVVAGMALPPAAFRSDEASARLVLAAGWGAGHYLALALSGGVLLASALELRRWLRRRVEGVAVNSAKEDAGIEPARD
jgi:hypothetical protein